MDKDKNIEPEKEKDSIEMLRNMLETSGTGSGQKAAEIEKESLEISETMLASEGHDSFTREEGVPIFEDPQKNLTFNERMADWGEKVFGTASLGSIFLVFMFGFFFGLDDQT
ncbi:MAG: hypothetical protein VST70_05275 [Nitrospirota bacterium]|nr:hypothetical protein [Nitrospirota bacterium]